MISSYGIWHWLLLFTVHIPAVAALHESDVGVLDWHKALIGSPNLEAPFTLPQFHRVRNQAARTTTSILVVGTKSNVLAGLDTINGSLVWRHQYPPNEPLLSFATHPNDDLVASQSGPGGSKIRVYSSLQGQLICENQLHALEAGRLEQPAWLGSSITFDSASRSVYALTNGNTITKLDEKCNKVWSWESPALSQSVFFIQTLITKDALYVVGMAPSTASYTLQVASISPLDGTSLENIPISSSVKHPTEFFFIHNSPKASLVWLQDTKLKHLGLDPNLKSTKAANVGTYSHVQQLGQSYNGFFVAEGPDGTAQILRLLDDGSLKNAWEFSDSKHDAQKTSPSIYSAGFDKEGNVYIARTFWSFSIGMASMNVYSAGIDGKGMITGLSFPYIPYDAGIMQHVALDISNTNNIMIRPRHVLSTSFGTFQLWDRDIHRWTRDEGLAEIVDGSVQFVELPVKAKAIDVVHEGFIQRLQRQAKDAQHFPAYLRNFLIRLAASSSVPKPLRKVKEDGLFRDAFGFRKVVLVASANGKIYALDSSDGSVIYSATLALGGGASSFRVIKLFITRTILEEPQEEPQAVAIVTTFNPEVGSKTFLYAFDALSGSPLLGKVGEPFRGVELFRASTRDAYQIQLDGTKVIVLVDEFDEIHLHPNNPEIRKAFAEVHRQLHIPLLSSKSANKRLVGHQVYLKDADSNRTLMQTWSRSLPSNHRIQSIFKPPPQGPVASFGKVLSNRTTLYKYLNKHIVGVVSASLPQANDPRCTIHLVDGVTGGIVYQANIPVAPDAICNVKAAFAENWLVYHYWDPDTSLPDSAKGWRMVSVEFYEGSPDVRLKSSELSSFSLLGLPLSIYEQSFVVPRGISTITMSNTASGISAKAVIVATNTNQIILIPRQHLDPRRPKTKPTAKEQEDEWLVQYDPLLPDDPKRFISHKYDVASIRSIYTSPTHLESTSLVFAHGLDLFLTRVAPSGTFDLLNENFNKTQLVLTIIGLSVALLVTRPMVRRKRLREKWYF